jgi:hypothetical protein
MTCSHQFATPATGITVTARVAYNNGDPEGLASVDVNVVDLELTGNFAPLRGNQVTYRAAVLPAGAGCSEFRWAYGSNSVSDLDLDLDGVSTWGGRMVAPGTLTCTARIMGLDVTQSHGVVITPRAWSSPLSCVQDNEPGWGPLPEPEAVLAQFRDRDSNLDIYFVPRTAPGDWRAGYNVARVTSGPCLSLWYISSSTLRCQRETVISQYLKPDGPTLGGYTFQEINDDQACFSTDAAAFLQAVKNHEYRGTPEVARSLEGRYGRMEKCLLEDGYDAKKHIEPIVAESEAHLCAEANDVIAADEQVLVQFAGEEAAFWADGPNWGWDPGALGAGYNARWNPALQVWTACENGPGNF